LLGGVFHVEMTNVYLFMFASRLLMHSRRC